MAMAMRVSKLEQEETICLVKSTPTREVWQITEKYLPKNNNKPTLIIGIICVFPPASVNSSHVIDQD